MRRTIAKTAKIDSHYTRERCFGQALTGALANVHDVNGLPNVQVGPAKVDSSFSSRASAESRAAPVPAQAL
jgi:hypothetical protein